MAIDSGMRVGALGPLRVMSVEFSAHGALIHLSKTSRNLKSTPPKAISISWSAGYLNKWLDVHPMRNEPDAPMWLNITGRNKNEAWSYHAIWQMLKYISKTAGIGRKALMHLFRHNKIVDIMLAGYSDQQIKFQAGWDKDMITSIYRKAGLETETDQKVVTLKQCPRCSVVLPHEARMCHQCALILNASLSKEKEVVEDKMQRALLKMMENQEVRAILKEIIDKPE
jgi:hypothetical protein